MDWYICYLVCLYERGLLRISVQSDITLTIVDQVIALVPWPGGIDTLSGVSRDYFVNL